MYCDSVSILYSVYKVMLSKPSEEGQEIAQRIEVGIEVRGSAKRLKICLENHHESLGWYTAGCLSIPLHQLPLLEQAIQRLKSYEVSTEAESLEDKIIPFDSIRSRLASEACQECDLCVLREEQHEKSKNSSVPGR